MDTSIYLLELTLKAIAGTCDDPRDLRFHVLSLFWVQRMVGLFFGGLNAASTLSVIVVVIYGAYLTIMGNLTAGSLTSFILYSLTGN